MEIYKLLDELTQTVTIVEKKLVEQFGHIRDVWIKIDDETELGIDRIGDKPRLCMKENDELKPFGDYKVTSKLKLTADHLIQLKKRCELRNAELTRETKNRLDDMKKLLEDY